MKNILGTTENLDLYTKEGIIVYKFIVDLYGPSCESTYDTNGNELTCTDSDGFSYEYTRDSNGNVLTYKNSNGYSSEYTYDLNGNILTYKNSDGFSSEKTYDFDGRELTFKNSEGESRGFDIPKFTMEQMVQNLGNFKLKK